jgi:hypothetical protein
MSRFLLWADRLFDVLAERWEGRRARTATAWVLIASFFAALVVIELSRQGLLPSLLGARVPTSHFYAIDVAFTLFLVVEVLGLVFGLATSVADALGKQFEIFSLILLRQAFKELVYFEEPIQWSLGDAASRQAVQYVLADAAGALLIFAAVGVYYHLQRHRRITETEAEQRRFVAAKKVLALTLLAIFLGLGAWTVADYVLYGESYPFFDAFYTLLIFSDVLIVLISLRYSSTYHVVFRNSGFAAATVMIRLALAGPRYYDALIGFGAALFAIGLTAAYNRVGVVVPERGAPSGPGEAPPPEGGGGPPGAEDTAVESPAV